MLPSNKQNIESILKFSFASVGLLLTTYIGFATFGLISNSKVHYANFVMAILTLSSIYGAIVWLEDLNKQVQKKFARWLRLVLLLLGSLLAIPSSIWVRMNAVRLDTIHPFFEERDFYIGLALLTGVLLLNWFHWGLLLTSLIFATIIYFFFGEHVPIDLLQLPGFDANFVMNYLGLGLSEGMFWFARVCADNIYFLIIFASILLGIGMLKLVIEVGKLVGNRVSGGAAFPAIVGSGIASVMGQAVANVVLTGRLTIPMMKNRDLVPTWLER